MQVKGVRTLTVICNNTLPPNASQTIACNFFHTHTNKNKPNLIEIPFFFFEKPASNLSESLMRLLLSPRSALVRHACKATLAYSGAARGCVNWLRDSVRICNLLLFLVCFIFINLHLIFLKTIALIT